VEAASSVNLGTVPAGTVLTNSDYVNVTASKTVFLGFAASAWAANILTDTAGTASAGTEITGITNGTPASSTGLVATGNVARFALGTGTSFNSLLALDCSGASPTLSKIAQLNNITGGVSAFLASDQYGVKNQKVLISGQVAYALALNGAYFDQAIGVDSVSKRAGTHVMGQVGNGISGGAMNESFFAGSPSQSTVGFYIQRVESAA
jgi:hypothetical protein